MLTTLLVASLLTLQSAPAPSPRPLVFKDVQRTIPAAPPVTIDKSKTYIANFETTKGPITVELYAKDAPITVNNFIFLTQQGFYDGLTFHRYEPGFVIQGGDPAGSGMGGPGYTIKDEYGPLGRKHVQGALGMARTSAPNSSGSQFYFTLDPAPHLDGKYTVFGQITAGLQNALALRKGDKMTSVTITTKEDAAPTTQPSTPPTTQPAGN
jgi:cyclophilin family peptidyl-prolyl cis-trans isomerase